MESTKIAIIDAAIATFIRYGARKTAMADIANAAGVSRQTLYDHFGNKNELVEAAISRNTDLVLARIEEKQTAAEDLADQLDIYLHETVVTTFERLQISEDVEDLISGHNEAGRTAIRVSHDRHKKVVTALLKPHEKQITLSGQSATQLAAFLVKTAMSLKHSSSRRELNSMLHSLKNLILLSAAPSLIAPVTKTKQAV